MNTCAKHISGDLQKGEHKPFFKDSRRLSESGKLCKIAADDSKGRLRDFWFRNRLLISEVKQI